MQNAPAFRLQSIKTERRVRVCEFLNRTLFLHLPAELVQRLDMPEAFTGNGAEGQGAEEVNEKDLWNAELQPLLATSTISSCQLIGLSRIATTILGSLTSVMFP